MTTYLIRTSEFFDRFCIKKGPDQPYYHRRAYEIRLHAEEKYFFLLKQRGIISVRIFYIYINIHHFVRT